MSTIEVKVPDIGDFKDVPVIEIFVKPGDTVKAEDSLVTLESDKATMDVPSPVAGMVKEVKVKLGDKVAEGIADRRARSGRAPRPPRAGAAQRRTRAGSGARQPRPCRAVPPAPAPAPRRLGRRSSRRAAAAPVDGGGLQGGARVAVGAQVRARARRRPRARRRAPARKDASCRRTCRASSRTVMSGAGPRPRRPRAASAAAARSTCCPWPTVDFAKFGPVETRPLSRIKKISGANLARNWVMIPHVTQFDEADITDLEAFRVALNKENEKSGVKVTMLAFLIKASVAALKKFPDFNARSLDGDNLVLKQYFHIGFAADTPNGLVVPVISNADQKGVLADREGDGRAVGEGARGQARPGRDAGRLLLDLAASAASAAPRSRRSSTRPKSRSSACRRARPSRSGTARRSRRG